MKRYPAILACALLGTIPATAQEPAPKGMSLATAAAKRFSQPVRVGSLLGRTVLQPLESRPVLGRVKAVVRRDNGAIDVVVNYGGVLGIGTRLIAVPVEAMALLGEDVEILDYKPSELQSLPTFDGTGIRRLACDDVIRVGLARPSH